MRSISDACAERLLRDLVAIPSPSCQEAEASAYLADWMRSSGCKQAYVDEAGNAIGIIGSGPRELLLLGHIDTFAGFPAVRQAGRKLFGRGAVDAKGPLCAFAVCSIAGAAARRPARHRHRRGGRRSRHQPRSSACAGRLSTGLLRHWRAFALGSHHPGLQGAAAARLALARRISPQRRRRAQPSRTRYGILAGGQGALRCIQRWHRFAIRPPGCFSARYQHLAGWRGTASPK